MPSRDQLNIERRFSQQRDYERGRIERTPALLGTGKGVVAVPNRPGWVFVRLHGLASKINRALCKLTIPMVDGFPVDVTKRTRTGGGGYQVVGASDTILYPTDRITGFTSAHGTQHMLYDRGIGGFDPTLVTARMLSPLRARAQDVPDMTLAVAPGPYFSNGAWQLFAGGNSPAFTAPGTGSRWDLLYLGSGGALAIATGTEDDYNSNPIYPTLPLAANPIAFVYLAVGTTAIHEVEIFDARPLGVGGAGASGDTGVAGPQGDTGVSGPKGDTGTSGSAGSKGDTGTQGDTGLDGAQGDTGSSGSPGAKGDTGSKGDTGAQGDTGTQGDTGADSTVPGPKGDTGTQGDTGSGLQGDTGADSTVPGPKGDSGTQGDTGIAGAGVNWRGAWNSGTTYATDDGVGYGGSSYVSSQDSNLNHLPTDTDWWDLWVAQGDTGSQGDTGAKGDTGSGLQGDTGADSTVPGPKGDTGVGTKGDTGTSGGQGAKGDTGTAGAKGDTGAQGDTGTGGGGTTDIAFLIDGGGIAITTGSKGFLVIDFAATITDWAVIGNASGSIVIDVKRSTWANFPTTSSMVGGSGNKPTLSAAQNNKAAVSSWTSTSIAAGDVLEFNVDSASTVQRVSLILKVTKS